MLILIWAVGILAALFLAVGLFFVWALARMSSLPYAFDDLDVPAHQPTASAPVCGVIRMSGNAHQRRVLRRRYEAAKKLAAV